MVEGHKVCLVEVEPCGEVHFVLVHSEMCQAASEFQQGVFGIAVFLILFLAVIAGCLMRPRILELKREERQAVHVKHHVYLIARMQNGVSLLTGDGELVLGIFYS